MSNRNTLFPPKALIGVVHLPPLPGSPNSQLTMAQIIKKATYDAQVLAEAGFDGIIVENFGDAPFFPDVVPAITVSAMTAACMAVANTLQQSAAPPLLGVNVLRNDAVAALSIAKVCQAHFIRVNVHSGAMITDQGIIQGKAHDTLRLRKFLAANNIAIFCDILVKHASPLGALSPRDAAKDTWHRGHADGLIVSGSGTGQPTDPERLAIVKASVPQAPIFVGSGTTLDNLPVLLAVADACIVGTALKIDGQVHNPVDPKRAAAMIARRETLR